MPGKGKDIAGKVVNFLREKGGKAVISTTKDARPVFDCFPATLNYSLHRLMNAGVISVIGRRGRGLRQPEFVLLEEFKKDDDWRKALKRKSSDGESGASPGITAGLPKQPTPVKAHTDNECLQYRITLSRDLIEVYKRLEEAQGRIVRLQDEIKAKDKKIEDLTGEIEAEVKARKREVNELATLELQLRELRGKTSISERLINFDGSGVMIAKNEGLPDRA